MKPLGILRVLLFTAALAGGLLAAAPRANAATVDILVDSTTVTLNAGDNGVHVAKVTLANISDKIITLAAGIPGDGGCDIKPDPRVLDPGRLTETTLTLSPGCDVAKGADVTLTFSPVVRPSSYIIKVAPKASAAPDWSILFWAYLPALVLTLLLVGFVMALRYWAWPKGPAEEVMQKGRKRVRVEGRSRPRLSYEIQGLDTNWSFKENWAGSVTIGSTVLIGLFAASNVLEAILGAKPEAALGLLAVSGGIATLLVGLGPLVVKSIGTNLHTPTLGGAVLAAGITLVGVLGQAAAAAIQAWRLTSQVLPQAVIAVLTALVFFFVVKYAVASITDWIDNAAQEPPPDKESQEVKAAKIIAKAIAAGPQPQAQKGQGASPAEAELPVPRRRPALL